MKSIAKILMVIVVLLSSISSFAQIKNPKTEAVKISGNCGMCQATIEKSGNVKKEASVEWNKDTHIATLTYDNDKTNPDEILKRIALAGYDSEKFLAPDDVYAKLPRCCQYDRVLKPVAKNKEADMEMDDNHDHSKMASSEKAPAQSVSQLTAVFDNYFAIKDAMVKTDATTASSKAASLGSSVSAVDMAKLSKDEHLVWMKVMKGISTSAANMANTKDISKQREVFAALSDNIYKLAKVSRQDAPIYYQHCPMYNEGKGANWLSKENEIKNPYYGSQMLTCGRTVETL